MGEVGRAVWSLASAALLVVAGAIFGLVGWALGAFVYAKVFEDNVGWPFVPAAVMGLVAAVFAWERQLRPLAGGIFFGAVLPVLFVFWLIDTTGA